MKITAYKIFMFTVIAMFILSVTAADIHSQGVGSAPYAVTTPGELAEWLQKDFRYCLTFPDRWQTPEETMEAGSGDCEDFAVLASYVLDHIGVSNEILVIKFKGTDLGHVICMWKETDGSLSYISNRKLYRTGETDMKKAIERYYPEWESVILANGEGMKLGTMARE
jgi:hypothetical protein